MDKQCRGTVCIINVYKVIGMNPRNGTDTDCDRLTELFYQLHFNVVAFNDKDGLSAAVSYATLVMFFVVL